MTIRPILMYHGVGACAPHGEASYTVGRDALLAQLRHLDALRVPLISLPQLLGGGHGVTLTFDDGEETALTVAAPLLARFGGVGVAYVTSDWLGTPGYLNAAWTIGAHGRTHRFLSDLPAAELRDELRGAKAALEDVLGAPVCDLSLPGGRGDRRVLAAAREAGYTSVATSIPGLNRRLEPGCLERLAVRASDDIVHVGRLATGHLPTVYRQAAATGALAAAKRLLGNRRYEQVRALALKARRGGG
jgi:peptidoglycan/xylan/chitin deacetylase (PgdA/CDA1 family)